MLTYCESFPGSVTTLRVMSSFLAFTWFAATSENHDFIVFFPWALLSAHLLILLRCLCGSLHTLQVHSPFKLLLAFALNDQLMHGWASSYKHISQSPRHLLMKPWYFLFFKPFTFHSIKRQFLILCEVVTYLRSKLKPQPTFKILMNPKAQSTHLDHQDY